MKSTNFFSLVELLIIIAVLMFLSTLLMTSGNKMAKVAQINACLNQHKQLSLASGLYQADNGERLPFCNWRSLDFKVDTPGWLYKQRSRPPWNESHLKESSLYAYLQDTAPYRCPAEEDGSMPGTNRITSYLMNGVVNNYGRNFDSYRVFDLDPKSMILFEPSEEPFGWMWNDGSSTPGQIGSYLPKRHDYRSVISNLDGSSEILNNETYFQLLNERSERLYPKRP